jgi:MFS transporter, DHA3 family, macrolide efflux protein
VELREEEVRRQTGEELVRSKVIGISAGTALGGIAFALIGPAAIFLFNGGSFLLSALEETFIRLPRRSGRKRENGRENKAGEENVRRHLIETLSYLKEDRGVLSAILSYGLIQALYPPVVIALPFFLDEELSLGPAAYGYAMALLLVGGGAGALLYGFFFKERRRNSPLFFGALILLSFLLIGVGLQPRTWLLFSALPLAGISLGTVHQIMTTSLYHGIRTDSRGRVFGIMESLASAALPLSYGLSGAAVGLFRGHLTAFFLVVGIVSALAATLIFFRRRLGPFISGKA